MSIEFAMNPEVKAKWVAALRSGQYTQGTCFLKRDVIVMGTTDQVTKFCCLGVLCDIAAQSGVNVTWKNFLQSGFDTWFASSTEIQHDIHSEQLPACVQAWAGLDSNDPVVTARTFGSQRAMNTRRTRLSELNDHERFTFYEIADLIEEQL
jgi:hypothetical protein